MKTIITKVENKRVAKFIEVDDAEAADKLARVKENFPSAILYDGAYSPELFVELGNVSIAPIVPTEEELKTSALQKMEELESKQMMTRGEREAWIVLLKATAAGQGVTEPQLYAANKFYKKLKDLDAEMAALRDLV